MNRITTSGFYWAVFATAFFLSESANHAFGTNPTDELTTEIEAAKADHAESLKKAGTILDLAIKQIATDQTIDAMKTAIAEKDDFLRAGKVPQSEAMKAAVASYQ